MTKFLATALMALATGSLGMSASVADDAKSAECCCGAVCNCEECGCCENCKDGDCTDCKNCSCEGCECCSGDCCEKE